jgi:hypothetical protein
MWTTWTLPAATQRSTLSTFTHLREHRLVINVEKFVFGASSIQFLGHHLLAEGVEPLPKNVSEVTDFPRPPTVEELQMFLGMVNLYRHFLWGPPGR